ncbi:MAG: HAD-IG family 5'-nucleotidase [Polyangiaceae bacterium]|nr:HAD-IG family 5'-nucleotidase [Polyangiaceae bacterium]
MTELDTDSEQLSLPLPDVLPTVDAWSIPQERRVFVNRGLRLTDVDWIGFDMDYTLAIYDQKEMDRLQIEATLPRLVARGYPALLLELEYDFRFPIRGLMVDKKLGNVLKLDRYKIVQKAWHGLERLDKERIRETYYATKLRLLPLRYHWVDTLYALAEVTMYATIVDAMERRGLELDPARLFTDIREAIDEAHRDGTILDAVAGDLPRYVARDPELAVALHKWRSAGKRLFVLTNSRGSYTDKVMTYLLDGAMPEYPSWRHYFDVVVVAAGKPGFFQERRPMQERDAAGDVRPAVLHAERGKVFEGGNLLDLERLLETTGDRVLYVGDHIYGDILRSKKESAWRTAMIIQEMVDETRALSESRAEVARVVELEQLREQAEEELRYLQARFKDVTRQLDAFRAGQRGLVPEAVLDAERLRTKRGLERVRGVLRQTEAEVSRIEAALDLRFHRYWGSLMKEAVELSSFGSQVEEYACVYTSRVSNFALYSPLHYFRSPRDTMPHEL